MLNFFKKLLTPFSKIKSTLSTKLRALFSKGLNPSLIEDLEQLFYEADLGAAMAVELAEKVRLFAKKNPDHTSEDILQHLKAELLPLFENAKREMRNAELNTPHVVLLVGVNGSGKTTTLAKLAAHYRSQGKAVLIAAGDTFRAAAVEQIETWAHKVGVPLIKSQSNSDPSAVAFDALAAAKARNIDIVLIDTAGRLQTKTDLMQELAKVRRVCQKQIPDAPHETLLVIDATVGQNALDQAKIFHQFTPLTGIVLTKLDGSAKGGIAVAIQKELQLPILWAGLGEKETDLIPFDAESYLNALLGL